jgi:hypothetical protein
MSSTSTKKTSKTPKKSGKKLVKKNVSKKSEKTTKKSKTKTVPKVEKSEVDVLNVEKSEVDVVNVEKSEVDVVNVPKVAVKTKPRKFNNKIALAKTTGLNISPAKVKNVVSNGVLNKKAYSAITELRNARARTITKVVNKTSISEEFNGIPVAQLSDKTKEYIEKAHDVYESSQREEYNKQTVSKWTVAEKEKYQKAKESAKALLSDKGDENFNLELFNTGYDVDFYKSYNDLQKAKTDTTDEWKLAIDKVSKLKNRFSTHSRILLSAFVESLTKQLVLNGTYCCVNEEKRILQLSHVLNTKTDGFDKRAPLFSLITNLSVYKQAVLYLEDPKKYVHNLHGETDVNGNVINASKVTDLFSLEDTDIDKNQFIYYISETCREVRMDLALSEKDSAGDPMTVYNYTSVSKVFKNFFSALICEFLTRVGKMLETEIQSRGIKTVNDTVIRTVISHYHVVCGVSEEPTFKFIEEVVSKYYKHTKVRQQQRREEKNSDVLKTEDEIVGDDSGDLTYTNED